MPAPHDRPPEDSTSRHEADDETQRLLPLPPEELAPAIRARAQTEVYETLCGLIDRHSLARLLEQLIPAYRHLQSELDELDQQMLALLQTAADFAKAHDL